MAWQRFGRSPTQLLVIARLLAIGEDLRNSLRS
jgi:hypothetical protein